MTDHTVFNEDCLEVLKRLEPESIDVLCVILPTKLFREELTAQWGESSYRITSKMVEVVLTTIL